MPELSNCKPWCEDHLVDEGDCQMRRALHISPSSPQTGFSRGLPAEVNEIYFNAWQDEDSVEPCLEVRFWRSDDGRDEPTCVFRPNLKDLELLHARIGEAIQTLRQSQPD